MTGIVYDWTARERGSHDWRLLPAAACGWAASLATHAGFDYCMAHNGTLGMLPIAAVCAVPAMATLAMLFLRLPCRISKLCLIWHSGIMVCVLAAVSCSVCALTYDLMQWRDPASRAATEGAVVIADVDMISPMINSDRRSADCQADARVTSIIVDGVRRNSMVQARVYVQQPDCDLLRQGGSYVVSGAISAAEYGAMPLWLDDVMAVERTRSPSPPLRMIDTMQRAFFAQTSKLSDQGKVLVPGLTLGILGQDHVPSEGTTDIDPTYAGQVEDAFRRSGIVHLMAVSGGHLAVVAALVRAICSFFLIPRRLTAVMVAIAYIALATCVFPSDSVSRALFMGLSGAVCLFLGRRGQAMASLGWTTLAMLMLRPQMSQSYGFALSCAAVLGLVLFSRTLSTWLESVMPRIIAETMAMTVSAQVFTLPIQVLLEPELPVFSVPANLVVAPVVNFSTLAGLAGLSISWLIPPLGLMLVRIASWGTAVMELVSLSLGSGDHATIPWTGGAGGVLLICGVEAACMIAAYASRRLFRRMLVQERDMPGERMIVNPMERLRMWTERTRKALHGMTWER